MNILVTGAQGQLGKTIEAIVSERHFQDRYFFTGHNELDITDAVAVKDFIFRNRINAIINCAAYTMVDKAETDSAAAQTINSDAVSYIAEAAAASHALLVHISTDYVFDGRGSHPYTELDKTGPETVYGKTKLSGEEAVIRSGCRYLIIRTSWLYSAYGHNFVDTMSRLTAEKENIRVVADQWGSPTSATDLAQAILRIISEGKICSDKGEWDKSYDGIYHYSNEGACTWYDLAKETARLLHHDKCRIEACTTAEYPTAAKRPSYSVLDKTRFKTTFGIAIPQWQDSLKELIANG